MANYSNLKTAIENAVDWNNGDNEITGQNLLDILETMIDSLGAKYKFADVATPSSSITTPDEPLFYLAGAGTYTNFSGLSVTVPRGTLAIFYYDTAWHYTTVRTDSDAFFNVNQYLGAPSATYTKANARNAVPEALRSKGVIITYLTTNGWIIEQNLSTSGTWNADANWQTIGPVSVSQNTQIGGSDLQIGDNKYPLDNMYIRANDIIGNGITFVSGTYNSDGSVTTNGARIRTLNPTSSLLSKTLLLESGWWINEVYYYSSWTDNTHFTLDHRVVVGQNQYTFESGNYVVGFSIRKADNSTISVNDFLTSNYLVLENRFATIKDDLATTNENLATTNENLADTNWKMREINGKITLIDKITSQVLQFERGSFNSDGSFTSSTTRIRTINPINGLPFILTLKSGWWIYEVYYYSAWSSDSDFTLDHRVVVGQNQYTFESGNYVVGFSIRKSDNSAFSVEDFMSANVGIETRLPQDTIKNNVLFANITPWEPANADSGYSNPTSGWGRDTKRADWTATDKYTYYEFLAHYYDTYLGVYNNGDYKVTKKGLWQDGAHTGHEIFEYDFCPKNYKYTIMLSAGMNADETQGIWGLATFIRALMNKEETNIGIMKDNIRFKVIPIINASGFDEATLRYNYYNNVNPNFNFNYIDTWSRNTSAATEGHPGTDEKGTYPDSNYETVMLKQWVNSYKGIAVLWLDLHTGRWDNQYPSTRILDVRFSSEENYYADFNDIHAPLVKSYYVNKGTITNSDTIGGASSIRNSVDYAKHRYALDVCGIISAQPEMHLESTAYGENGFTNNAPNGIKCYVLQIRQIIMFVINKFVTDKVSSYNLPKLDNFLFRNS